MFTGTQSRVRKIHRQHKVDKDKSGLLDYKNSDRPEEYITDEGDTLFVLASHQLHHQVRESPECSGTAECDVPSRASTVLD